MNNRLSLVVVGIAALSLTRGAAATADEPLCPGPVCAASYVVFPTSGWIVTPTVEDGRADEEYCEPCQNCSASVHWSYIGVGNSYSVTVAPHTSSGTDWGIGTFRAETPCDLSGHLDTFWDSEGGFFNGVLYCNCAS